MPSSKSQKTAQFDPSSPADTHSQIFGLPFTVNESDIIVIPVPWDVTTSYKPGTANGPNAIYDASFQVDLYHPEFPGLWQRGIAMLDSPGDIANQSLQLRGKPPEIVNPESEKLNQWVENTAIHHLNQDKKAVLLGGDHSVSLGYFKAIAKKYSEFGILQIDAHMDLRVAYEGFTYSHASIMENALKIPQLKKLTQVGIRDFCEAEMSLAKAKNVSVFTDAALKTQLYQGKTWHDLCQEIAHTLPRQVVISFDIDGLDPSLCPNTGTPVPGGFSLGEILYLIQQVVQSGRKIIGFDLVEVAPGPDSDWDANVGARALFQLCGYL